MWPFTHKEPLTICINTAFSEEGEGEAEERAKEMQQRAGKRLEQPNKKKRLSFQSPIFTWTPRY